MKDLKQNVMNGDYCVNKTISEFKKDLKIYFLKKYDFSGMESILEDIITEIISKYPQHSYNYMFKKIEEYIKFVFLMLTNYNLTKK